MSDRRAADRRRPYTMPPIVITLHYDVDTYQSAECQLGAHHACPGGARKSLERGGVVRLRCQCDAPRCACPGRRDQP